MRVVNRIAPNVLNSAKMATMRELAKMFQVAPNMAAKTIRLYPQNSLSMFSEGLGEIYDIREKSDNFEGLNDQAYKWKIRGHAIPNIKLATRVTGGAISAGSTIGAAGVPFVVAFGSSYYNPRDIVKLENGQQLAIESEPTFISEGVFEYNVTVNTNDPTEAINTTYLVAGHDSGLTGKAFPEMSERGYINAAMAAEEHINYITKVRYDWSWSADAAATKYLIQDTVQYNGKDVNVSMITDQLWMNALEQYHFLKEMEFINGRTTMDARGRCFRQDEKGQDIIKGDGLLAQIADSGKQNYTSLTIGLLEDMLTDMSLKSSKRTGNTYLFSMGAQAYKEFGRIMRAEHRNWSSMGDSMYVHTKNGKIVLGAEYSGFMFQGNALYATVNGVFDHPANVSVKDEQGRFLESWKILAIDAGSYNGVRNLQMIAKNGRSFVTGELDGVGGPDGKTSGKVSSLLDGSAKTIIGTLGIILHNPYSSYVLSRIYV